MSQPTYTFTVTMRFQHPAWDEVDGIQYIVQAATNAEANDCARRRARNDGHLCGGKGRVTFKAVAHTSIES